MAQIYDNSSFERFGDELSQTLLSCLEFKNCFRYECVSKQFQRLVFKKQNALKVGSELSQLIHNFAKDNHLLEAVVFEEILSKLPNIGSIEVTNSWLRRSETCLLLVRHCSNLTQIESDFEGLSESNKKLFFDKFGPNLKRICFRVKHSINRELVKEVLKLCPNLSALDLRRSGHRLHRLELPLIFGANQLLVKSLTQISFNYLDEDSHYLRNFVKYNKNSLESIEVRVEKIDLKQNFDYLINKLLKLSKLKVFSFYCKRKAFIEKTFLDSLRQMTINCPKLLKLELTLNTNSNALNAEIFQTINCFKGLKRLKLELINEDSEEESQLSVSSQVFTECRNLTHLTLITNESLDSIINDNFFDNIDNYLPKLQEIHCLCENFSDRSLHSLAKLPVLRNVYLIGCIPKPQFNESVVLQLIRKSRKLESIYLQNSVIVVKLNAEEVSKLRLQTYSQSSGIQIITNRF